jgi:hypothetical protein
MVEVDVACYIHYIAAAKQLHLPCLLYPTSSALSSNWLSNLNAPHPIDQIRRRIGTLPCLFSLHLLCHPKLPFPVE